MASIQSYAGPIGVLESGRSLFSMAMSLLLLGLVAAGAVLYFGAPPDSPVKALAVSAGASEIGDASVANTDPYHAPIAPTQERPDEQVQAKGAAAQVGAKGWSGDASKQVGPMPASYLRPAAALEADKDAVEAKAQAYYSDMQSKAAPEHKLWFASDVVDLLYDEANDADWSEARAEAVTIAYLDCLGKYSAWLRDSVSEALENNIQSSADIPPLARALHAEATEVSASQKIRWSQGELKANISSMADNYVGGLVVNRIVWGDQCVAVVCVVTETTRKLQAYCRGAIKKDQLPQLEPLGDFKSGIENSLQFYSGGIFTWVDASGTPCLNAVASVVNDDTGTEVVEAETTCKGLLALFMGAQVSKGQTVQRLVEMARSSTVTTETGEDVKVAVVKRRKQIVQELKANAKIGFGGGRITYQNTTRLDQTRLKNVIFTWSPSEQELAELRKTEQDQLRKFGGRVPTGDGSTGGASQPSGGPLAPKNKPAPKGKGETRPGVD